MTNYNYMDSSGKKVMRLTGIIIVAVLCMVIAAVYIVYSLWLDWLAPNVMNWILIIGFIIVLLLLIFEVIIIPIYKFKIFKYKLTENEIIVINGFWFIKIVKIPLFRIQNVDTHEGILMRKYGLSSITLSTAGGNAKINLIKKETAILLKKQIKQINYPHSSEPDTNNA